MSFRYLNCPLFLGLFVTYMYLLAGVGMTDQRILTEWLPQMKAGSLGLEQFTQGGLYPYQSDVASAWELLSWTPDGSNQPAISATRRNFLRKLQNDSLVFGTSSSPHPHHPHLILALSSSPSPNPHLILSGLSHTDKDESDMVSDTSISSKILTVSEVIYP